MIPAIKDIAENGLDVNLKMDAQTAVMLVVSLAGGIILGNLIAKRL